MFSAHYDSSTPMQCTDEFCTFISLYKFTFSGKASDLWSDVRFLYNSVDSLYG